MPGLLEGSCVRCGCAAVCREGRAAADMTDSRTVASPGHGLDRSEPEEESQIKSELIYLKHSLLVGGREYGSVAGDLLTLPYLPFSKGRKFFSQYQPLTFIITDLMDYCKYTLFFLMSQHKGYSS